MTSVVSEEILTRKSTAQDDRMKGTPPNPPQWRETIRWYFQYSIDKRQIIWSNIHIRE